MKAPELNVVEWINTPEPITLTSLRGKVVMITAFQMLCPGCVKNSLPQAQEVHQTFHSSKLALIGLHSVFEHHEAMTPVSLNAFLHEYQIKFPVAIDTPSERSGLPRTMIDYQMEGTPTTILIDHKGFVARKVFGHLSDLVLGAEIMSLIKTAEADTNSTNALNEAAEENTQARCSNDKSD